ncbi:hypothetical protein EDD17DRAFT_1896015 [Pisolithus thermaeus]|nr:hypothetical protein EDD17DRAFT_1896015 [Pisolithus thermaeus]
MNVYDYLRYDFAQFSCTSCRLVVGNRHPCLRTGSCAGDDNSARKDHHAAPSIIPRLHALVALGCTLPSLHGHASPSPTSIVTAVTPARFPMQQCRDRSSLLASVPTIVTTVNFVASRVPPTKATHVIWGNQQTRSSPFVRSAFPPRFESLERRSARVFPDILPGYVHVSPSRSKPLEVGLGDVASRSVLVLSHKRVPLDSISIRHQIRLPNWRALCVYLVATRTTGTSSNVGFREEPVAEPLSHSVFAVHRVFSPLIQRVGDFGKAMEQECESGSKLGTYQILF